MTLDTGRVSPGHFVTAETDNGVRFTTGPAGIAWRPADTLPSVDVRIEADMRLHGSPIGYREAYGIFVGGRALDGPGASYLYLMVRTTGEFMVKRRTGRDAEVLVDWMRHVAVQRVEADGDEPVNTLAVEVMDGETRFLINGIVVFILDTDDAGPRGIAGVRVNHRLDVTLERWAIASPPPTTSDP